MSIVCSAHPASVHLACSSGASRMNGFSRRIRESKDSSSMLVRNCVETRYGHQPAGSMARLHICLVC